MNDCLTCGFPMAWSEDRERYWCAVYGDHRERFVGRNVVIGARPVGSVIRVDFDRRRVS